jgi:ABC-type glycerol-3-phosphate transport system substrate-binding protein
VVDYLAKNAPNLKYGVALQPRAKDWCTIAATRGFAVPKVSKNQEEAWKFIQWLVNDENCGTFFKNYGWQPWRTNVDYSAAYKERPALKTFQDGLKTQGYRLYPYPQSPPAIEIYARMADRLAAAFKRADLVDNPRGIAQVMSDMAKETNQILADNNVLAK